MICTDRLRRVRPVLALAVVGALLALSVCLAPSASARDARVSQARASATVARCGYVRASVPYSRTGSRDRWGVYLLGATGCRTAEHVLWAVMHLRARAHEGRAVVNSYFSYRGWRCDFGQMGTQSCWTPSVRPYRAQILARNCGDRPDGGCPREVPRTYLG